MKIDQSKYDRQKGIVRKWGKKGCRGTLLASSI